MLSAVIHVNPVADPGGGGGGVRTPPFGPRCRLFNIGPKVGPPPFFVCSRGGDRGDHPPCPECPGVRVFPTCPECPRVGVFFNFSEGG